MIHFYIHFSTEEILFPFGQENGDEELTKTAVITNKQRNTFLDLASPTIRPTTGFPLGSEFYYSLYVSIPLACVRVC